MADEKKKLRAVDVLVLLLFAAGVVWFEAGFFLGERSPAPILVLSRALLIVLTPLLAAGIGAFYLGARTGRISRLAVASTLIVTLVTALIALPIAMTVFARRSIPDLTEFHPYLQLAPPDYQPRAAASRSSRT